MKDKTVRKARRQNTPRPRWPVCVDVTGNYIVFGSWRIIRHLGYFRKSTAHKGHHKYLAKCVSCGVSYELLQDTLVRSERLGITKCRACKQRINHAGKQKRMEKSFQEWVTLMRNMRATPLEFRKGFDSERQAATIPIMCACGYKR